MYFAVTFGKQRQNTIYSCFSKIIIDIFDLEDAFGNLNPG